MFAFATMTERAKHTDGSHIAYSTDILNLLFQARSIADLEEK